MRDWTKKGFFAALEADALTLLIYGVIAEEGDEGEPLVRATDVVQRIQDFGGGTINVFINSPGGVVADAVAIHSALRRNAARKLVQIDGVCASAATIIAMAGDRISAAPSAMLMVHPASNAVRGNAADLRHEAAVLDTLTEQIARLYVQRTHRSLDEVLGWMRDETWLTAAEAKALGLIDEVVAANRAVAQWDCARYGLPEFPGRTDGAASIAELQREVRALRSEIARMNVAGGPVAAAVLQGLGETFQEFIEAFKEAALEALASDPALLDGAANFREDMQALREDAAASGSTDEDADELAGASAAGETELARLMARVKRGPGR